jgi:hypothetical protein
MRGFWGDVFAILFDSRFKRRAHRREVCSQPRVLGASALRPARSLCFQYSRVCDLVTSVQNPNSLKWFGVVSSDISGGARSIPSQCFLNVTGDDGHFHLIADPLESLRELEVRISAGAYRLPTESLSIWQALDIFPNAPMPSEPTTDPKFEIGHVLFIDMVGYSQLLINEQSALLDELNTIVRGTNQFRQAENEGGLLRLPSGDGMALVFRDTPESPAQCALEIGRALRNHPRLLVRMGIHSGPVNEVPDVNQRANLAGAGINLAQRVMDCGDAGHILLSKRVADDLAPYAKWRPYLHEIGECQVKHGVRIQLVSLHNDDVGNPQLPTKFRTSEINTGDAPRQKSRRQLPLRLVATLAILAAALVAGILLLSRLGSIFKSAAPRTSVQPTAYANRSYENAKWSKIYGADRLFPAKPSFQKLFGWDRKNLAITGTIWPDQLLLLLQKGEWKVNRLEGPAAISVCRFVNEKRVIFLHAANRGMADLMSWEGAAYQRLGTVPAGSSLVADK